MQIDYDILPSILLYSLGFFLFYYILYKRYIYSVLDPLFIYIFTISFSSVLVLYTLEDRPEFLIHFFVCHVFLYIGFVSTSKWLELHIVNLTQRSIDAISIDHFLLRRTVYILFFIYSLANIALFYTTGFALLSDEPTLAKVENFTKGFGIILKINWGVGSFITAALLYFILIQRKLSDFILLAIVIIFTSLEGSKSSLLRILITLFIYLNHHFFYGKNKIVRYMKWIAPVGLLGLFGVFFTVLFKENADTEQAIFAFIRRLLYGADATLYFYHPVNEQFFSKFNSSDYLGHFLNPILAFLRLSENQEALGNVMVMNALPDTVGTIVGPNTPYYIEGQVYFGYYGAFVYSFAVGGAYAFIRKYFFYTNYYSSFWFVLICCICQQAYFLNIEVTLFITQLFDTCFFVIPAYVTVSFFFRKKVTLRPIHF